MSRTKRVRLACFSAVSLVSALYVWSRYEVDLTGFYQDMSYGLDISGGESNATLGIYMDISDVAATTVVETDNIKYLHSKPNERWESKGIKVDNNLTMTVIQDKSLYNVRETDIYNVTQGSDTNQSGIDQTVIIRRDSAEEIDLSNSTEEEPFPNKSCSFIPNHLVGRLKVLLEDKSWEDIEKDLVQIEEGGEYSPATCNPKDSVAIIIPFRNRDSQLRIFLNYIHPILMRQNIHYRIFVLSQEDNKTFNRAMLFNVGFAEASKISGWDCFIFHDVDLLPEDDRNLYTCPDSPRHMSVAVDKFKYNLPYKDLFGGVSAISTEHFNLINGFSNQFWGWGGEDDDMSRRVRDNKLSITRYKPEIARWVAR